MSRHLSTRLASLAGEKKKKEKKKKKINTNEEMKMTTLRRKDGRSGSSKIDFNHPLLITYSGMIMHALTVKRANLCIPTENKVVFHCIVCIYSQYTNKNETKWYL